MEARQLLTVIAVDDVLTTDEDTTLTAAATATVVAFESDWTYLDTIQNDLGNNDTYPAGWNTVNFDDSSWPVGTAPFEAGTINAFNGQTTTPLAGIDAAPNGTSNLIYTYLMRIDFNLPSAQATLDATFIVDDGAVFYIDGNEVGIYNLTQPVDTNTQPPCCGDEDTYQTATFDVSGLAPGNHVLAVELHNYETSSDSGMDIQLTGAGSSQIADNDNLANANGPVVFQLVGAGNAVDSVNPNIVAGTVTMDPAGGFTFTPTANYNGIATFDYRVSDNDGASTATVSITVNPIEDAPVAIDDNYHFPTGATISTDAALSGTGIVVAGQTVWNYHDENGDVEFDSPGWNTKGWTPQDFNNFLNWKTGVGEFGFGNGVEQTTLLMGDAFEPNFQSYYFQNTFSVAGAPQTLYLNVKRDDGVVIYINGVEVLRDNMPIGVIDQGTPALGAAADDGFSWTTWAVSTAGLNLTPNGNSIAAEVHQPAGASSDLAFDLQMTVTPNALGVLDNDSDAEDATNDLTLTLLDSSEADAEGTLTFNTDDGTFTFVPDNPNFNGEINFTYQIEDSAGGTDVATVSLFIGIQNEPPVAVNDAYTLSEGGTLSTVPIAPPPTEILPLGEIWSYLDNIYNQLADPAAVPPQVEGTYPVDWNQPGFDDSTWLTGRGGFEAGGVDGLQGQIGTTLDGIDDATTGENLVTTYLFRTTFDLPVASPGTLTADLVADDGVVIYIDGIEVFRDSNIPAGVLTTSTTATGTLSENLRSITMDVAALNLAEGEHTLAVELHQVNLTSSDVGFDMNLTVPVGGLSGVLANDTDAENDPLAVVGINGDVAGFVAGQEITLPSGSTLVMKADGSFDYTAADGFDGADVFTYQVQDSFGNTSTATVTMNVVNVPDPPVAADDSYTLNNPNGTLSVPTRDLLLAQASTWVYLDTIANELGPVEGTYPTDWNLPGIDVSSWKTGPAPFEAGGIDGIPAGTTGTTLEGIDQAPDGTSNLVTTYLFRTTFDLAVSNPDFLFARFIVDDGAVFYIDGQEVGRTANMPNVPLTTSTLSGGQISENLQSLTFDVSALNLAAGQHTLAVELHQSSLTSSDVGFDMDLSVITQGGVLLNDSDPDSGAVLSVSAVNGATADVGVPITLPSGATLTMNADGSFDYSGDGDQGVDSFTYTVSDGTGLTDTATVTIDIGGVAADPPQVVSVELNANEVDPPNLPKGPQPARWQPDTSVTPALPAQRSFLKTINITFDQNVQSAGPSDFVLTNLGIKADTDPDSVVALDASQVTVSGATVTISFGRAAPLAGQPDIRLPDGVYQLEILDSITNTNGEALDGDGDGTAGGSFVFEANAANNFYKLGADWNGDKGASIFDFGTFAYWFGESVTLGVAPEYADLNGDGGVSIFDFGIFAANFGKGAVLPAPFVGALVLESGDLTVVENEEPVVQQQVALRPRLDVQPVEARRQNDDAVQDADRSDADEDDLFDVLASDVAKIWTR